MDTNPEMNQTLLQLALADQKDKADADKQVPCLIRKVPNGEHSVVTLLGDLVPPSHWITLGLHMGIYTSINI